MVENWMLVIWVGSLTNSTILEYHDNKETCSIRKVSQANDFQGLNFDCVSRKDIMTAIEKDRIINLKLRGIKQ